MKKSVSPGVVVLIVAVLVIVIGLFYMKKAGPGANSQAVEDAIQRSVVKPGAKMPGNMPSTMPGGMKMPGAPVK